MAETDMYSPDSNDFRYRCGLVPGQVLRLIQPLKMTDSSGRTTGEIDVGTIWAVLRPGYNVSADKWNDDVLWLREPDGSDHTWSDDDSVFEFFEVVDD